MYEQKEKYVHGKTKECDCMSERIYINNNWKFSEIFSEEMIKNTYDESEMVSVRLPHTCKETPYHYFDESEYQMVSGYRRIIHAPKEWKSQVVMLTFEGIAHEAEVYVNGKKAGAHHCGYTEFTTDISEYLRFDEDNILTVKVDSRESLNQPPFGKVIDYMTYGGIYRDAYLEVKNPDYIQDVYVVPEIDNGNIVIYYEIKGSCEELQISLKHQKQDVYPYGRSFPVRSHIDSDASIKIKEQADKWKDSLSQSLSEKSIVKGKICYPVEAIDLWQVDNPILYDVKVLMYKDGKPVDEKIIRTGFRRAQFREDGFYLNGKKLKIRGLNRHQSYPYVGYAMPKSMQEMDAEVLKNELGLNAVRTSHYPQSHHFLNRCDELGLLVFTEIPGWQHIGDEKWKEQAVQNTKDMVKQYRNHTSIISWGVRINESPDDDDLYKRTNQAAHELDPHRPTGGVRNLKKSSFLEDIYTYNDFVHNGTNRGCEKKINIVPDMRKPYMITEYNGHMYPTKAFDCEDHRLEHAMRHARVLNAVAGEADICGSFGWCMADYNTHKDFGSGDRICYHGVLDMFRNHKLAAEVYASQCDIECGDDSQQNKEFLSVSQLEKAFGLPYLSKSNKNPVLAVSSSMDIGEHPGSNCGKTYIFTNADSVRMYKNDQFISELKKSDSEYRNLPHGPLLISDYIGDTLEKNEAFKPEVAKDLKKALNVVARYGIDNIPKSVYPLAAKLMMMHRLTYRQIADLYGKYIGNWGDTSITYRFDAIKDGKVVKSVIKQSMKKVMLKAEASHTTLREEETYDVAAVRICAVDENGNVLPYYQEPVSIRLEGPAELIGPDVISLKGGMGGTYIKSTGKDGTIKLTFKSVQAEQADLSFVCQI